MISASFIQDTGMQLGLEREDRYHPSLYPLVEYAPPN